MEFIRKATILLACLILFSTLETFGFLLAVKGVVARPQPLENALHESNIYPAIVNNFVQTNKTSDTIGVSLGIPSIQSAVHQAFPPSTVESATNQVINGIYNWTTGKTSTVQFSVNLTGAKTNLATYVSQAVQARLTQLPTCSLTQLQTMSVQAAIQNPYSLTCIPPDVSTTAIADEAKQAVLDSSFLKNPVLTPATFHISGITQPTHNDSKSQISLPHIYNGLMRGLYCSLALIIICLGAIIWLHRDRLHGLRRAGATAGWAGLASLIDAVAIGRIASWVNLNAKLSSSQGISLTQPLDQAITKAVTFLAQDFHEWLFWYGISLFVVGAATWSGIRIWEAQHHPSKSKTATNPADAKLTA